MEFIYGTTFGIVLDLMQFTVLHLGWYGTTVGTVRDI